MVISILPVALATDNTQNPFTDVDEGTWYYKYVQGAYEQGLMVGTSATTFSPNTTLSRAMVAQILYNKEGKPQFSADAGFTDVSRDAWYYDAVQWAAKNKVAVGVGDNKFAPDADVTREQFATMLYNYAEKPEISGKLTSFPDKDSVSSWAKSAMFWVVSQSIVSGSKQSDGTLLLMPQSGATRAEAATMIYRYVQVLNQNIKKFTVTFDSNGGSQIESQTVVKGEKAVEPNAPTKDGYTFDGWYTDEELLNAYDFDRKVTKNLTLYAKWTEDGSGNDTYTRGEWIALLADMVEMNVSADPDNINYYYADTSNSEYAVEIETAEGYGILPDPDVEDMEQDIPYFYPDKIATREFAAYTALAAMGYDMNSAVEARHWSDWNNIKYQTAAVLAIDNAFMSMSNNLFQPQEAATNIDAKRIKNKIDELNQSIVVNPENARDESVYQNNVIRDELASIDNYSIAVNNDIYTIRLPKNNNTQNITAGKVLVLPANHEYPSGVAVKVNAVKTDRDVLVLNCSDPNSIAEVYSKINFAGKGTPLVDQIKTPAGITCEYSPENINSEEVASASESVTYGALDIDIGGTTALPGKLTFDMGDGIKISDKLKLEGEVEVEIPEVTGIVDAKVGWTGVEVDEFTLSIQEKVKIEEKLTYTVDETGYYRTDSPRSWEGGKIEIGRVPVPFGTTGFSADIVFYFDASVKGTASITYTMQSTQGFQYKNGSKRWIFDFTDSLEFIQMKGSAKGSLNPSINLTAFEIWDIVGYEAKLGIAVEGGFTPHVLATDTLFCGDVSLYAFVSSGINEETIIGDFLKNTCHYTLEFEHLKNTSSNPWRTSLHIENGILVDECTFGMGAISGCVKSLEDDTYLYNARVEIYNSGERNNLIRRLYTNTEGAFSLDNLTDGTYKVLVSATGFYTYDIIVTVTRGTTQYIEPLLMVDRDNSGTASMVTGTITDAVTGRGIENTKYVLRKGWENTSGESIASGTFDSENYSISLGIGNYTLEVSKNGYVTNHVNIAVGKNVCSRGDVTLSPEGTTTGAGELRVILTWGESPSDLDSHMFGPKMGNPSEIFHIYYRNKKYSDNDLIADLDLDDTSSYGPETTTVHQLASSGIYSFYVHDYTNRNSSSSSKLSESSAKVQIYKGNSLRCTLNVPVNTGGTVWHVFDYDAATDTITPVNTFGYSSDPQTLSPARVQSNQVNGIQTSTITEEEVYRIIANCEEK